MAIFLKCHKNIITKNLYISGATDELPA